jgi:hypothetical protein
MIDSKTGWRSRFPIWARPAHPVYKLERQRQTRARGVVTLRHAFIPLIFLITGLGLFSMLATVAPLLSFSNLSDFVPVALSVSLVVMVAIQLVMGAIANVLVITQTTPAISGEVELQSWRLLRTTTLPLRDIVWSKFAAALSHLNTILAGLLIIRIASSITSMLLFLYIFLRTALHMMGPDEVRFYFEQLHWVPLLLASFVFACIYVTQPIVQFAFNGMIGMVASVFTNSRARAIATALVIRLVIWVFVVLLNIALIFAWSYIFSDWVSPYSARLEVFRGRPSPDEISILWVLCITVVGYTLSIFVGQLAMILTGLGFVHRRARRIGV